MTLSALNERRESVVFALFGGQGRQSIRYPLPKYRIMTIADRQCRRAQMHHRLSNDHLSGNDDQTTQLSSVGTKQVQVAVLSHANRRVISAFFVR